MNAPQRPQVVRIHPGRSIAGRSNQSRGSMCDEQRTAPVKLPGPVAVGGGPVGVRARNSAKAAAVERLDGGAVPGECAGPFAWFSPAGGAAAVVPSGGPGVGRAQSRCRSANGTAAVGMAARFLSERPRPHQADIKGTQLWSLMGQVSRVTPARDLF